MAKWVEHRPADLEIPCLISAVVGKIFKVEQGLIANRLLLAHLSTKC